MSPEDAYLILEAIVEIHSCLDKLHLINPNEEEVKAEETAKKIETENKQRAGNLSLSEVDIPVGSVLTFINDESITCKVVDDRRVDYNGEIMYLSGLAKKLLGKTTGVAGPRYFKYRGAKLWDIDNRQE